MPEIQTIDITKEKIEAQKFISETLHQHIDEALNHNQQVLLFLNRKGYAPLTLCNKCGFRHQCNNCRSWLVEHKRTRVLTAIIADILFNKMILVPNVEQVK